MSAEHMKINSNYIKTFLEKKNSVKKIVYK